MAPASITATALRAWIRFHGVSRGTRISFAAFLQEHIRGAKNRLSLMPCAMRLSVPMEQGTTIMPSNFVLPLAKGAFMLLSECSTTPGGICSSPISSRMTCFAYALKTRCNSCSAGRDNAAGVQIDSSTGSGSGKDQTHFRNFSGPANLGSLSFADLRSTWLRREL